MTLWVNPHPQARKGVTPKHNKLKKKNGQKAKNLILSKTREGFTSGRRVT